MVVGCLLFAILSLVFLVDDSRINGLITKGRTL